MGQAPALSPEDLSPEDVEGILGMLTAIQFFHSFFPQVEQTELGQTWQPTLASEELSPEEVQGWMTNFFSGL